MKNIIKEDKNITSVLNDDAIKTIELKKFENLSSINNLEKNIYLEALEELSISSKNRTK